MIEIFNNGKSSNEKSPDSEPVSKWTVQRVALATVVTLAIGFGFFLLYQFYMVVFILFVAITLAIAVRPIVDWFKKRGLPEWAGILIVYLLLLVIVTGFALAVGPLLVDQISTLLSQIPGYYSQLRNTLASSHNRLLDQLVAALPVVPTLPATALSQDTSPFAIFKPAWDFIRTFSYIIFILGAIGVLAYYLTIEGEILLRRFLLLTPINRRDDLRSLLAEMAGTIGSYFRGQAILCGVVGLMSLIGYWAVGLQYAIGLAIFMTVCEAIPMIGPALGAIPALLVALSTSPTEALWVLGIVIVIQETENHLLVPRVMNESVGVNPIVSILSIAAFGALFGFGGAVLAIPLAAMLQIVLNRLFFHLPSEEEPALLEQVAGTVERNAASKLRLQTQELVLDVRNTLRAGDAPEEAGVEEIEDSIEAIANDLDALLGPRGADDMKDFALKVTVVFAIVMAALVLYELRDIITLVLVSFAITAAMHGAIAFLTERGIRQSIAIVIAYVVGLAAVVGLLFILGYPLTGEFTQIGNSLMTTYTRLANGRNVFGIGRLDAFLVQRLPTVDQLSAFLTGDQMPVVGQAVFDMTQNISTVIGQFLLAMVLSIYWTADHVRFERFWLSLLPSSQRVTARDVWHTLETQVGSYLRSEIVQGILVGLLLAPGFWLLGVPYPVIWSLLIALAWFVPLVGGLIFLLPLWLITWAGEGTLVATAAVLYTIAVLMLMEFFVEPRFYTRTRNINVVVVIMMLILVSAYGFVGLLIAPLLAIAVEIVISKLAEESLKPAANPAVAPEVDLIGDQEVAVLQARLDEIRPLLSDAESPNNLRLANIAERLESLLKEAESL